MTNQDLNNIPKIGGKSLLEIAPENKFSDLIFELLSGYTPKTQESKLFQTILNLSIIHRDQAPSSEELIDAAKVGHSISDSLSKAILKIDATHGAAVSPAMELLYKMVNNNSDAEEVVNEYLNKEERMPGFGHRIYKVDPRSQLIFKLIEDGGFDLKFMHLAKSIEKILESKKAKPIPINIDGAIAVVLCTFGWKPELGNSVFIIARIPGLCTQYIANKK